MEKPADKSFINKDSANTNQTELEELRYLLLAQERSRIEELENRLNSPEIFVNDVGRVLPEAIQLRSSQDNDISKALEPNVEEGLRASIKKDPKALAEVLFPIMGPAIRKAITSALLGMTQAINKAVEHSVSAQGIKWRLEAMKSDKPFAEIVLLNTLEYQIEQIFLIHNKTGLVLHHVVADDVISQDPDLVSGMLTAIQDFISDSFVSETQENLDSIRMGGNRTIWIDPGQHALLATVIRGTPPIDMRYSFGEMLGGIHRQQVKQLESFDGDVEPFDMVHDELQDSLVSQVKEEKKQVSPLLWLLVSSIIFGIGFWSFTSYRQYSRWVDYLELLNKTPGIVITNSTKVSGQYHVYGLLDTLAPVPEVLLKEVKLEPHAVAFHFEPYISLHPEFNLIRARNFFKPPLSVTLEIKDNTISVRGTSSRDWIEQAEIKAGSFPGISLYDDKKLVDIESALKPPKTVVIDIKDNTISARGTALTAWIKQAGIKAATLSGIDTYDDSKLIDAGEILKPPRTVTLLQKGTAIHAQGTAFSGWIEEARRKAVNLPGVDKYDDSELFNVEDVLKPPETVVLEQKGTTIVAQGTVFNSWIEQARQKAVNLPGIDKYDDSKLVVVEDTLKPPETVVLVQKGTTIHAQGTALNSWIKQARQKVVTLLGVTKYDDSRLVDAEGRLNPPRTVVLEEKGTTMFAKGTTFGGWIKQARRKAVTLPGIDKYDDSKLVDIEKVLKLPKSVVLKIQGTTVSAQGTTSVGWIEQARRKAVNLPGIDKYDDSKLIDIEKELKPPKSVILKIQGTTVFAQGTTFSGWIEQALLKAALLPEIAKYDDSNLVDIEKVLKPPPTVSLEIRNTALFIEGTAFSNWIEQTKEKVVTLQGISHCNTDELVDVEVVLHPPATVSFEISNNTLFIKGAASNDWIEQARQKGITFPDINQVDFSMLADLTELAQVIERVEKQEVFYYPDKYIFIKGQEQKIWQLNEDLLIISSLAHIMNKDVYLEITGHAQNFGWDNKRQKLSKKRARYLFERLVANGMNKENFIVTVTSTDTIKGNRKERRFAQLKVTIGSK